MLPLVDSKISFFSFLFNMDLSILSWNVQGCTNVKFPQVLCEYRKQYQSDIVSLLEPKVSRVKANAIIASLNLAKSHRVEAIGFSSGIWLGLRESIDLKVIKNHPQFILVHICSIIQPHLIFIAFVYGSLDGQKKKFIWRDLSLFIPLRHSTWLAIGDFNAILSSNDKKGGHVRGQKCSFLFLVIL